MCRSPFYLKIIEDVCFLIQNLKSSLLELASSYALYGRGRRLDSSGLSAAMRNIFVSELPIRLSP